MHDATVCSNEMNEEACSRKQEQGNMIWGTIDTTGGRICDNAIHEWAFWVIFNLVLQNLTEERRSLNCTVACLSLIAATPAFQVLHLHLLQRATSQGLATRYFRPSLTQRQVDKSYYGKAKLVWQTIMLGNIPKANGVGMKSSIWRRKKNHKIFLIMQSSHPVTKATSCTKQIQSQILQTLW
jgi:hypothetical protein